MLDTFEIKRFESGQEFEVSRICQGSISEINSKDLSEKQTGNLLNAFTPRAIISYASKLNVYVAITAEGQICGTGTLAGNQVRGVFVDVKLIGKGIGRQIMVFLEKRAGEQGEESICLSASKYAVEFYKNIGYKKINHANSLVGPMTKMEKKLA